jgi:hypothetical protein
MRLRTLLLHACSAGIAGLLASFPFDTVKVRLQMQTNGARAEFAPTTLYRGMWHCGSTMVKEEGL